MQYGYFDYDKREYVITQPETPLPWINYLGNENYFAIISNTAGGYSFYQDARLRRLTRYRYNNVPLDVGGRYIYLRDNETGKFWSPTWQPTRHEMDSYTCRHGLGYTDIHSESNQISTQVRYFVPLGENLEAWVLSITNRREEPAELSVFSCIEFALWDANDDATNFQRNLNIGEVEVEGGVIYHKTEYRERRDHFAYFACSAPLAGYDTQREVFLGTYRGWENPVVVEMGASRNSHAHGWAPIGSHHVKVSLGPGDTKKVIFLLGYFENRNDQKFDPKDHGQINKKYIRSLIKRYLDPDVLSAAFEAQRRYWDQVLGVFQIDSPDEHTDRMVNIWNPYQCMVTFNLSRSASYFESGIGRGLGFRDSNQDLLGFVHMVPERARERILDLAGTQREDGGVFHQYQPLTKRGNENIGGNFNDDPLWMVLSVAEYIKETGDWGILDQPTPYNNVPGSEGPLYDHLDRSIGYTLARLGPNRLPLIGRADWNDCLNLNTFSTEPGESFQTTESKDGKVAESVFIAGLFILAAKEMAQITKHRYDKDRAKVYEDHAAQMEKTILESAWDGNWFLRAYDAYGDPVGSHQCEEGRIFIEAQGLCIMAGVGIEDGRAQKALRSVKGELASDHGIVLHQPAYTRYYLHLGEISSYPPGYKENASVFCHTNPWIMIAEAMLGNGDQAFDYYMRINPSKREAISDIHRCEPYVYAQTIAGRDAPTFGEAKNSWLTGTAAWNYVAITQWILGIRPTYEGLKISPVIPKNWTGFRATRTYRSVTYKVQVKRIGTGNAVSLEVHGKPIQGDIIPLPDGDESEINVLVTIH
jgi:cellobiose phosphorylase